MAVTLPQPVRLRTCQAAALANVSPDTLNRWARRGILPAPTKVAGRLFWDARHIEALLVGGRCLPAEGAGRA